MWILTHEAVDYCEACGDLTDRRDGRESIWGRGATAEEALSLWGDLTLDGFEDGVFEDVRQVPAGCEEWATREVPEGGFARTQGEVWRLYRLDRQ